MFKVIVTWKEPRIIRTEEIHAESKTETFQSVVDIEEKLSFIVMLFNHSEVNKTILLCSDMIERIEIIAC